MGYTTRILFPLSMSFLSDLEADTLKEAIDRVNDVLIERVELRPPVKLRVSGKRSQEPSGERRVDAFKEFEKHQRDSIAVWQEPVPSGVWKLLDKALCTQLRELVAERREAIVLGRSAQGCRGPRVEVRGGERALGRDVGEADERMHHGELPRVVQLQSWDAFAVGEDGGLAQGSELAPIDERFQDVLLHMQIGVDNRGQLGPQLGEMVNGLGHPIVRHVVGSGLGTEQEMIADVLLDEPVAVVAADDRVREVQVLNHRLQLAAVALRDASTEDHGDLVRLPDRAVGIQEPLPQIIEGGPPMEDQVVAVLDLRKEQTMLAAGASSLLVGEEWGEAGEPFLPAAREIACRQGVGQFLEPLRVRALQEGVGALLEADALGPQLIRQPMVLVETDAGGERKVRTDAYEHAAPAPVVHVEVVLDDPALSELQVPAVVLRVPDGDHDPGRFSGLQDHHHFVGLRAPEVRLDKLVAPPGGCIEDGHVPRLGAVLDPALELVGNVA